MKRHVQFPNDCPLHQESARAVLSAVVQEWSFLVKGVRRIGVREGRVWATLFISLDKGPQYRESG